MNTPKIKLDAGFFFGRKAHYNKWLKELTDDQQDLVIDMMIQFRQEEIEQLQAQNARLLEALDTAEVFWMRGSPELVNQCRAAIAEAVVNATEGIETEMLEGKHLNEIILERNRLRIEVENLHGKFTPILQQNARLLEALKSALRHQIANLGTDSEFYKCYTYEGGKMPEWVSNARAAIAEAE